MTSGRTEGSGGGVGATCPPMAETWSGNRG